MSNECIPKHIFRTKQELIDEKTGRVCVCGEFWNWNMGEGIVGYHCNNKWCVHWNICTLEYSTVKTGLDLLFDLVRQKGFCKCLIPKYHSIIDYELCVNKDCFRVLREYRSMWEDHHK